MRIYLWKCYFFTPFWLLLFLYASYNKPLKSIKMTYISLHLTYHYSYVVHISPAAQLRQTSKSCTDTVTSAAKKCGYSLLLLSYICMFNRSTTDPRLVQGSGALHCLTPGTWSMLTSSCFCWRYHQLRRAKAKPGSNLLERSSSQILQQQTQNVHSLYLVL